MDRLMRFLRWVAWHRTLGWSPASMGVLLLLAASSAQATETSPKVTNGGYMQTIARDGSTVVLPLKHTDVQAEIAGMMASVQVTQQFQNPSNQPIEAIYVFPLPHRASVYAMEIKVGKRTIKGVVKKRAEARQIYETAKAQGKTAALLEQERPNIFTQSVANILPGDDIRVTLTYVENMTPEGNKYEFVFPMVVGPRYVGGGEPAGTKKGSGWGVDTDRIPDASRITPTLLKKGMRPGHDIAVRLQINGGVPVKSVHAVAHQTQTTRTNQGVTVQLDPADSIPNKDFVVRYQLAGKQPEVAVLTHRDARGGHFLMMVQPKAKMQARDIAPLEYVFVVDNSGSMNGFPLQQAQKVVRRSLSNLKPRDTFQIIKFAGRPDQLAPRALAANPANIRRAISYVTQMRGGGGTEFLPALKLALTAPKSPNRARIVVFVTDGYIGYEKEVLRFLRNNIKDYNLFALGIGSSVNRFLIDGMARIGAGEPFYLLNTEKAPAVVQRIFATISQPALTHIDIDWGNLQVEELTPSVVPDLFGEKPVFVLGRFAKGGQGTVTIKGRLAGRAFRKKVQVKLPEGRSDQNQALAYLWARRRIADWMEVEALEPERAQEIEPAVTKLALKYNLMSKFTSFVAVDQQVRNQGGNQVTTNVPVPLPDGVSPQAAPSSAYASGHAVSTLGKLRRGRALAGKRASPARSRRLPPAQAQGLLGSGRGGGGRVSAAEAADDVRRGPANKPRPRLKEDKEKDKNESSRQWRIRLVAATWNGNPVAAPLKRRLSKRLRYLAQKLARQGTWASGTLKLRLNLDASGRVRSVAFVSGSIVHPALRGALAKDLRGWTLGQRPKAGSLQLTLRFL